MDHSWISTQGRVSCLLLNSPGSLGFPYHSAGHTCLSQWTISSAVFPTRLWAMSALIITVPQCHFYEWMYRILIILYVQEVQGYGILYLPLFLQVSLLSQICELRQITWLPGSQVQLEQWTQWQTFKGAQGIFLHEYSEWSKVGGKNRLSLQRTGEA